jgi:hypothetical protein
VALQSKVTAGVLGLSPSEGMDVCLLLWLCRESSSLCERLTTCS